MTTPHTLDTHETKVIFRKWPKSQGGGILALFPQLPADFQGYFCESYEHTGQHAAASPALMYCTTPATPEEYAPLHAELSRIGYKLKVGKKFTAKDNTLRREAARR